MQEIKKENQAQEMSYEEALKAFKAEWAGKRKEERKAKSASAKAEKREATATICAQAVELLKGIDPAFNKELAPVVTRLNMFIKGEKYTRNFKGGNN